MSQQSGDQVHQSARIIMAAAKATELEWQNLRIDEMEQLEQRMQEALNWLQEQIQYYKNGELV